MSRPSLSPLPLAPRSRVRRGLAVAVVAALATAGLVVMSPAVAAPGPEDVTWESVNTPIPTADLLDVVFGADGAATDVSAAAHALTAKPVAGKRQDHLAELGERLGDKLDTRVKIALGAAKGTITIDFASVADLRRIFDVLGVDSSVD